MNARQDMWNDTQPMHVWDHATDFCERCGLALFQFVEQHGPLICPDNDRVTNLKARQQIDAMVRPILEQMGFVGPEVKH